MRDGDELGFSDECSLALGEGGLGLVRLEGGEGTMEVVGSDKLLLGGCATRVGRDEGSIFL